MNRLAIWRDDSLDRHVTQKQITYGNQGSHRLEKALNLEQCLEKVSFQFGASFLTRASLTRTSWARPTATRSQLGARQFGAFSQFGACQSDARQFDAF